MNINVPAKEVPPLLWYKNPLLYFIIFAVVVATVVIIVIVANENKYVPPPPETSNPPLPVTSNPPPPATSNPPPPPIQASSYCIGDNVIFEDGVCKFYPKDGTSVLYDMYSDIKSKILPTPNGLMLIDKDIANVAPPQIKTSNWMKHWEDMGGYNANKFISDELKGVNCDCGDCAGWRGGSVGSCAGKNTSNEYDSNFLETDPAMNRRVLCDLQSSTNSRCMCAYPFVPINGICVTPFEYNPDGKKPVCCPPCVGNGTCVGEYDCTGKCSENLVELPGLKYICNEKVIKEAQTALYNKELAEIQEVDDNYGRIIEVAILLQKKREEAKTKSYTEVNLATDNFSQICTLDTNTAHGMNEYECAVQCDGSQLECSRRCLPKLWLWEKVFNNGVLEGYIQSDKLIQYQKKGKEDEWRMIFDEGKPIYEYVPAYYEGLGYDVNYCPIEDTTCNTTYDNGNIQNCTDCVDCLWELNKSNEYMYNCDKCGKCNGGDNVTCWDNINCKNCKPVNEGSENIVCDICDTKKCITSKMPHNDTDQPYNTGDSYNPSNFNLWEDRHWRYAYRWGNPERSKLCTQYGKSPTCETPTNLNGNTYFRGELDGGVLGNGGVINEDCTNRGSCSVPAINIKEDKPQCYGTVWEQQLDDGCYTLSSKLGKFVDPAENEEVVRYGVSKGLSKDTCENEYCKIWNWDYNRWSPISNVECQALCEPELFDKYNTIPMYSTMGEQISYLLD